MKQAKKLLAFLLVAVLTLSLGVTAFADSDTTHYEVTKLEEIKVNNNTHTDFKAVQIFTGTQVIDGTDDNPLGDIEWGTGVYVDGSVDHKAAVIAAVRTVLNIEESELADTASALDVAKKISGMSPARAIDLAQALHTILMNETGTTLTANSTNAVSAGYYLVIDTKSQLGENDAYNASLLQMTQEITITKKTDAPTQEKKVQENVKTGSWEEDEKYGDKYNDVADYNIGDTVPFELLSKVPDMTYYDVYKFMFTDTMSEGLTLNKNATENTKYDITVTIGGKTLTYDTDYTVDLDTSEGKNEFTVDFQLKSESDNNSVTNTGLLGIVNQYLSDILGDSYVAPMNATDSNPASTVADAANKDIVVSFKATLNANATIGLDGNLNTSKLTYSNHPDVTNSAKDTPDDKVIVFTYELDLTKVDGTEITTLPEGVIYYKASGDTTETVAEAVKATKDSDTYVKRDDGKWYKDIKLEGAQFVVKATSGEHNGKYVKVDANNKVSGWTDTKPTVSAKTADQAKLDGVFISNANGLVSIIGLDDGTYEVEEIKAPTGYNKLTEAVTLEIKANTQNTQSWNSTPSAALKDTTVAEVTTKALTLKVGDGTAQSFSENDGKVSTDILNNKGAVLPSTGGIGTTLFYVVGGLLVATALVLLITKKRMNREG